VNTVLHAGAATAQLGWLLGLTTLLFLTSMMAWTAWAWWPSRKAAMDAAAWLPFQGDEP
jgi:cbb3-type cytochrome oxidase subunit 3